MSTDTKPQPAWTREPSTGMQSFASTKIVLAGKIIQVTKAGCFVMDADGRSSVFRAFEPHMTARYVPGFGDYWLIYEDGYQSISPKEAFTKGYVPLTTIGEPA